MIAMSYKQIKQLFILYHSACYSVSQAKKSINRFIVPTTPSVLNEVNKETSGFFHVIVRPETRLTFWRRNYFLKF